jgi:hypothetical protein
MEEGVTGRIDPDGWTKGFAAGGWAARCRRLNVGWRPAAGDDVGGVLDGRVWASERRRRSANGLIRFDSRPSQWYKVALSGHGFGHQQW